MRKTTVVLILILTLLLGIVIGAFVQDTFIKKTIIEHRQINNMVRFA